MSETYTGGCACGAVRYRLKTAPMIVHCCHCRDCQRQTGGAFAVNALIETDRIEMLGDSPVAISMPTDSGRPHRVFRCPACGTAVWSEYGGLSKLRFVRVGTLDNPSALPPELTRLMTQEMGKVVARLRLARKPKLRMRTKPLGSRCNRKRRKKSSSGRVSSFCSLWWAESRQRKVTFPSANETKR